MFDVIRQTGAERRRSTRVPSNMTARVSAKDIADEVAVLNVSFHGALLHTPGIIEIGETLNLAMHIPTERDPLDLAGRVVRVVTVCSTLGFRSFNVGIEFLDMLQAQKQKLAETIYHLLKKVGHRGG